MPDLGRVAYNAYCAARQWRSVDGRPLPQWEDQSKELQAAWRAAAEAVKAVSL